MAETPNTMTAVVQRAYGLDSIELDEVPVPSAGPGQLLIEVAASTVNPMDWHLATGSPGIVRLAEGFRRPANEIPGREACGVVVQVGPGVIGFEVGQNVFGWMTGAFAEYAIAVHRLASDTATLSPECQKPCHPTAETGPKPGRARVSGAANNPVRSRAIPVRSRQLEGS